MDSKNLNYAFNVEYYEVEHIYENLDLSNYSKEKKKNIEDRLAKNVEENNRYFYNFTFKQGDIPKLACAEDCFSLKTKAPGLLAGIGSLHEAGAKGELSLGFSFDYVTGVPYLPGSTVKGVLKSAFEKESLIKCLLNDEKINVKALKEEIFEGIIYCTNGDKKEKKKLPSYKRDVFFDCFISTCDTRILCEDYITPHGKKDGKPDPTKNPNPIKFIKIGPDVVFDFKFNLTDSTITAKQKYDLFREILKVIGIGAKTNVGYGALCEIDGPSAKTAVALDAVQSSRPTNNNYNNNRNNNQQGGKCKVCGKPTKINQFTGKPFPTCWEHSSKNK